MRSERLSSILAIEFTIYFVVVADVIVDDGDVVAARCYFICPTLSTSIYLYLLTPLMQCKY